ncbi:MAG: TolC family protein [Flavobacteriales bacterium]|jgi:outer membrane protein|nr:TolC family protein [Flavobacteriales bacterium]
MRILPIIAFALALPAAHAQQVLTLEQCVQRAEEKNLTVIDALLDEEIARAAHDQAKWDLAPDLNAFASHTYNFGRVVDRFTNTFANDRVRSNNFYLSANLALYQGGSRVNRIRQAGIDVETAQQAREAMLDQVRLEVVQAFLDVLGLRERIRASEQQVAATEEQVRFTAAMVEAGRLAQAELLTLRAQVAQEEFNLTDAQNQHDQRMLALGRAMQMDHHELMGFDITAPDITALEVGEPAVAADDVLDAVLRNNHAYAQAGLAVQSAERGIAIARAGHLPTLSLGASVGTGYSGLNQRIVGGPVIGDPQPIGFTNGGEVVYAPSIGYNTELTPFSAQLDQNLNETVGLQLSIPLFNNMRNRTNVAQARIRHEQSLNRVASVRNDLQREVVDALVMRRGAHRQYRAAQRAVEAGTLALEYAQERFNAGAITSIELTTAKTQLNANTAELINAKYRYVMAGKYLDVLQGLPVRL